MRSLIAAAILLAAAASSPAADGSASISWVPRLSPEASSCLKLRSPRFNIWSASDFYRGVLDHYTFTVRQTPSIVTGDFNGDQIDDVAVAGWEGDKSRVIAVFAKEKECGIVEISNHPYENPSTMKVDMGKESGYGLINFLTSAKRGTKSSDFEKSPLRLKTDAVIVNVFGKAATLYYFDKGVFKPFALAD